MFDNKKIPFLSERLFEAIANKQQFVLLEFVMKNVIRRQQPKILMHGKTTKCRDIEKN